MGYLETPCSKGVTQHKSTEKMFVGKKKKKKTERLGFYFFPSLLPRSPDIRRVSTGYDKKKGNPVEISWKKEPPPPPLTHSLPPSLLWVSCSSEIFTLGNMTCKLIHWNFLPNAFPETKALRNKNWLFPAPLKPILANLLKTLNPKGGLGFRVFTHFAHVSTFVAFV